jgi:hypothetical protein
VWKGSDALRAVRRTLGALEQADVLPGPGDVYTFVPDPDDAAAVRRLAYVRRVTGRNLWIWYWPSDDEVRLVALTDVPP